VRPSAKVILFLTPYSIPGFADQWEVRVDTSARVSHLYRNDEHNDVFKCWGGPGDVDVWFDQDSGQGDASSDLNGEFARAFVAGRRDGFRAYVPQTVTWASHFLHRDLTVEFQQIVSVQQTSYVENDYSTQTLPRSQRNQGGFSSAEDGQIRYSKIHFYNQTLTKELNHAGL
jgi:hypothetical protein